jgi:NAD(P)-dependent dehydrogenase (short-subunit alcohol dehydrogenase family)
MGRLSGRSAVITGAASGTAAPSLLPAAEGASLVIADLNDTASATAEAINSAGGKAIAIQGDAGDDAFVKSLVDRAEAEYGGLDIFWANAGISGGFTPLGEQTTDY